MGYKENGPFQFTFNGLLKVAFQGSHITSDAGLILVRELNERLGLEHRITDHLSDGRHGTNTQFRAADLLRQSVYSRLAGYEDLNAAVGEFSEERWRRQYNTVRPHSALGYRPPAPAAISPAPLSGMIMSPALS